MSPGLHRIAGGGNVAVLTVVAMILSSAATIFFSPVSTNQSSLPPAQGRATAAVLVVLDGLRAKTAFDARVMPTLCRLARAGASTTSRVECLIPSTVAGITTMGTGKVSSPASFLEDFMARPARDGGIFSVIDAEGGHCALAGPDVWKGRFGQWADDCTDWHASPDQNEARLQGGLQALRTGKYRLVVLHFDKPDIAEHLYTPDSLQYRQAASWCDDAVSQIASALPSGTCLMLTADHGAADGAGHGGPEIDVLQTPLVMIGPGFPAGPLEPLNQRDIPRLLARALGIHWTEPTLGARDSSSTKWVGMAGIIAVVCAWPLLASLNGDVKHRQHFILNAALWCAIALTLFGYYTVAAGVVLLALTVTAALAVRGPLIATAVALVSGAAFGGWRLLDAVQHLETSGASHAHFIDEWVMLAIAIAAPLYLCRRARVDVVKNERAGVEWEWLVWLTVVASGGWVAGGVGLALVSMLVLGVGALCASQVERYDTTSIAMAAGIASVMSPVVALRFLGQTLSLSAIDVREAFAWAWVTGGLVVAVVIALLTIALPTLAFWLPWRRKLKKMSPQMTGALAAGAGAALLAQILVPTLLLNYGHRGQALRALALDHQLRVLAETLFVFLSFAAVKAIEASPTRHFQNPQSVVVQLTA